MNLDRTGVDVTSPRCPRCKRHVTYVRGPFGGFARHKDPLTGIWCRPARKAAP